MGRMQKQKGTRFQNYVNRYLSNALGVMVATNPSQVGEDAGRDHLIGLPLCIQTTHQAKPNVWKKLREALRSARPGELSALIVRKNYQPVVVVMTLDEWVMLVRSALQAERG